MTWDDLSFWNSPEWRNIQEHLDRLDKQGLLYNPNRENLFAALDATPYDKVKVIIVGQDPFPKSKHATGIAFSIPPEEKEIPPTLTNIMIEYSKDLHYPFPTNGDLTKWTQEGVLLWNAIPSVLVGMPLSHEGWEGWKELTTEIITTLNLRSDVVFAFLGRVARQFVEFVDDGNRIIETSHPSPRGSFNSKTPFIGSRLFSTINSKLKEPINWRL